MEKKETLFTDEKVLFNELLTAKSACRACLENNGVLVGMHGLAYWAGEVERLRAKVLEII